MAAYVDYEYYTNEYGGAAIEGAEFTRLAKKAQAEVDHVTFGRITEMDTIPDAVKDCVCDVAEALKAQEETAGGGAIASEQNDGYSVSYRDVGGEAEQQREIHLRIRSHLARTGLMYRGVLSDDKFTF